jgi:tRNA A37 threonylcarbamoyladenosine modification protein TsaB
MANIDDKEITEDSLESQQDVKAVLAIFTAYMQENFSFEISPSNEIQSGALIDTHSSILKTLKMDCGSQEKFYFSGNIRQLLSNPLNETYQSLAEKIVELKYPVLRKKSRESIDTAATIADLNTSGKPNKVHPWMSMMFKS